MECLGAWAWSRWDGQWQTLAHRVERRGDTLTISATAPERAVLLIQAIVPAPETEPTHTTDKQMPRAYGPARRKKW